jgi:transposase-like protein
VDFQIRITEAALADFEQILAYSWANFGKNLLDTPTVLAYSKHMDAIKTPPTLVEAIKHFDDPDNALRYLASKRWPKGVTCPHCEGAEPMFFAKRRIWKCRKCRKQFSVKTQTIFEDSPLPLGKWLTATWLISNCKNGVSSYEIGRDINVTQKSAWFMLHRIRRAM